MDHLGAIAIFVRVVEKGSFTAAADALGLSQPAVSRAVTALEQRLGVRLLQRTTRRIALTEGGAEFYRRAVAGLSEIESATEEVTRYQVEPRGTVRVSAPITFSLLHLAPLVPAFLERYPAVRVDLQLEDRRIDLVAEGCDLAIRIGHLDDSGLVAKRIATVPVIACASPRYLARAGAPTHPQDLVRHDCIIYTLGRSPTRVTFADPSGGTIVVPVQGRVHTNSGLVEKIAAVGGGGITFLPIFYIAPELADGSLVQVLPAYPLPDLGAYAVYPERRGLAPKVRAFVDFVAASLRPAPWEPQVAALRRPRRKSPR
jgi:DNA-binding transcriptional LysR family regulator